MNRRVHLPLVTALVLGLGGIALAGDDEAQPQQVVVVNAASSLASAGPIARLRRVLDSRKLLVKLDEDLEATLDGRSALIGDLDAIKDAYASAEFDRARETIDTSEQRMLAEPSGYDLAPALAELSQWRGLIAAAANDDDEALRWFRAAVRFNPAWAIAPKLTSPRVRSLVKRAKREPKQTGTLRVLTDADAQISIDGGQPRPADGKLALPIGTHLVLVTAAARKPYAKLVEITEHEVVRIKARLDNESQLDRAARLVDATAAAPPGKPRLKSARALAKLTGVPRLLVVEAGGPDRMTLRLYDVDTKKVSKTFELDGNTPSATIARDIVAALEPENLVDVNTIVGQRTEPQRPRAWYGRWYVWAAVGAVAVGSYAAYDYASREPTMLRGL